MFTEDDYREYFQTILDKESAMVAFFERSVRSVDDPELLEVLGKISKEEVDHCAMAEQLLALVPQQSDKPGA